MEPKEMLKAFKDADTDAYAYIGPVEKSGYDDLCNILSKKTKKRKNVLLYMFTGGGNPNAGYRVARALIHNYEAANFRVAVPAECKSAGTLTCIGAHAIVMFDKGELGPLDVQFQKQNEIFEQSSGLDILRGMTYLKADALDAFKSYLLEINGGTGLSTKVASEIASNLVRGLYEPIFAQIDPVRLGEMNAALQIAQEYGTRLNEKAGNLKRDSLSKLINTYPTHGFVIDRAEARKLFERVLPPQEHEKNLSLIPQMIWDKAAGRTRVLDLLALFDQGDDDAVHEGPIEPPQGGGPDGQPEQQQQAGGGVAPHNAEPEPPAGGEQGNA